jgi:hypothetical protein
MVLVSALPAAAAPAPALRIEYNAAVHGDFAMAGNTVTTCPSGAFFCLQALERKGHGPQAQNNSHAMVWTDVDTDPRTYNSSSGRLSIPTGARVVFAKLTWAGNTGGCGAKRPPGSPREQAVAITVNQTAGTMRPEQYTVDESFYSAGADLTERLRGVTGEVTLTVGNIWTPQGFDCFGGWSAIAVWAFERPVAMPRKQITVYDANLRMHGGVFGADLPANAIRPAGGASRIGVVAYEGDWALSGDRLRVNGQDPDRTGNIFTSSAEGALNPKHPNNMSVDVRTITVPPEVIKAGDQGAELGFSSGLDAYLVRTIAVSTSMPELTAQITPQRQTVHEHDEVKHTIRVTNAGGAPATGLRVRFPGCDKEIPRLDGGQASTMTCATTVSGETSRVEVTGESLIGDRLTAGAETNFEVLRPAITASMTASPATVLKGDSIDYEIAVRNTGNTALSGVTADCANVGTLVPGQSKTARCPSSEANRSVPVSGVDKLGKRVTATAGATAAVVDPKVTITATPSTRAVRQGEPVRLAVTVANPSTVMLANVAVDGTPSPCTRTLGALGPGKTIDYTCEVVPTDRLVIELTARATPVLDGREVAAITASNPAAVVSVVPDNPPPLPPAVVKTAAAEVPEEPVPVATLIAGLAVLSNFVTTGAIAATACRKR